MKALLINGSPHEHGCTYTALRELADTLEAEGIETEIIQAGKTAHACNACASCKKTHRCVYDDLVNETAPKLAAADALVIQNTYGMGYFGVESAFKLLAGQGSSVEKSSITTTRIITRDNMFAMDKQKALFPFG